MTYNKHMRTWFLPALLIVFSLLSVLTLSSIAPQLAPKQLGFFLVGGIIFLIAAKIKFPDYMRLSPVGYISTIIMLILVLVVGLNTRGTSRWIDLGEFRLQPSQLAIPFVGLFLTRLIEKKDLRILRNLILAGIVAIIPAILILIEPDLGTTLVYLATIATVIYFKELNWLHITTAGVASIVIAVFAWVFVLQPYQKLRITSFLDNSQQSEISAANYNARQALIAVGSGKMLGRGLGQGVQSHLRFLPERQTDFVFASLAEEFGFLGSVVLIGLYALLITYLLFIANESERQSEKLFCYLTASMFLIQTSVNIGMNLGLLPITGLTLPLLSYGGSSILTIMGMLGIIQSIATGQQKTVKLHIT